MMKRGACNGRARKKPWVRGDSLNCWDGCPVDTPLPVSLVPWRFRCGCALGLLEEDNARRLVSLRCLVRRSAAFVIAGSRELTSEKRKSTTTSICLEQRACSPRLSTATFSLRFCSPLCVTPFPQCALRRSWGLEAQGRVRRGRNKATTMPGSHPLALLRGLAPTHRLGGDEIIPGRNGVTFEEGKSAEWVFARLTASKATPVRPATRTGDEEVCSRIC